MARDVLFCEIEKGFYEVEIKRCTVGQIEQKPDINHNFTTALYFFLKLGTLNEVTPNFSKKYIMTS